MAPAPRSIVLRRDSPITRRRGRRFGDKPGSYLGRLGRDARYASGDEPNGLPRLPFSPGRVRGNGAFPFMGTCDAFLARYSVASRDAFAHAIPQGEPALTGLIVHVFKIINEL